MTHKTNLKYASLTLAAGALSLGASMARADIVHLDDVIVSFSLCVGNDCVNGESFGFDTLRLKENNLRIHFQDTSTSASFPTNDWRIVANDSSNGGGSYLAFEDSNAARQVFRVDAGAPANALRVDSGGDVGIGTSNPVVDLHIVTGNTPTLRLEQNGSSGFTPQTWDVAGNEANFFIRDATNGSKLPFKIKPNAPTSSIFIEGTTGDIGLGTESPNANLEIEDNSSNLKLLMQNTNATGAVQFRLASDASENRRILGRNSADSTTFSQISLNDTSIYLAGATVTGDDLWALINTDGIELPTGAAFSVNGTDLNVPDYVFAPDYELMPLTDLQAFISENSHLPNIPSAGDVQASGLNMTEMQLSLLEKVEELTLYTLEQQKMIDALQKRLDGMAD